jgi:hypothetical protein
MRSSPSLIPAINEDHDIYLVLDDFGRLGRAWRETDEESTDRTAIIQELLEGQYSRPVRVISFNTAEGWSRDVSEEITLAVLEACASDDRDIPSALEDFIDQHGMPWPEQLALPLRRGERFPSQQPSPPPRVLLKEP